MTSKLYHNLQEYGPLGGIAWKIYSLTHTAGGAPQRSRWPIILAMVESGALYSIGLVALMVAYLSGSSGYLCVFDSLTPLIVSIHCTVEHHTDLYISIGCHVLPHCLADSLSSRYEDYDCSRSIRHSGIRSFAKTKTGDQYRPRHHADH